MRNIVIALIMVVSMVSNANAAWIGPLGEDHLFYRVHLATGALFCNHLAGTSIWCVSTVFNRIYQVDLGNETGFESWEQAVLNNASGNESLFLTILDRGLNRTGIINDNRCDECKIRWATEHPSE